MTEKIQVAHPRANVSNMEYNRDMEGLIMRLASYLPCFEMLHAEETGMLKLLKLYAVMALLGTLVLVLPASGALFTIPRGGTAFIGEQGLDITQTGTTSSTMIGWFGNGNNGTYGVPVATTSVGDAKNFYIAPSVFSGKTGPWYNLSSKELAFYVEDPSLTIRIFDETSNFELTGANMYVPKGDQVGYRVDTNLVPIANRPGITMFPITIHVRTPNGNELAEVSNYPLKDIMISSSPFSTGPVWDTSTYASGTYTVWAVCNVNSMKDNYPVDGKTETPQTANVQISSSNPLIISSVTPTLTSVFSTPRPSPVATTEMKTGPVTEIRTTVPPTAALTSSPASLPPATTKAPGPDVVFIIGVLGLATLVMCGRD